LWLAFLTLLFFIGKSILSLLFTRRIFLFLGARQLDFSEKISKSILGAEYSWLRLQSPHTLSTAAVVGASALVTNSLGQFLLIGAELSFLILFGLILFFINPLAAVAVISYFLMVMLFMRFFLGRKVETINKELNDLQIENQELLFESLKLSREIRILSRGSFFQRKVLELNMLRSRSFATDMWVQQIPKYTLEVALLFGVMLMVFAFSFSVNEKLMVSFLALYFTAGSRIIPSLLRIQSAIFSLQSKKNYAHMALDLLTALNAHSLGSRPPRGVSLIERKPSEYSSISPKIECHDMSFKYVDSDEDVLRNISFNINPGERVAIVGSSGSGKSTLCDVLLGLLVPHNGFSKISGLDTSSWIAENPGKVSYLPQEVTIINGTIKDNVCFGLSESEIHYPSLLSALEKANILDFVEKLPSGLETHLGPDGVRLSGGQKQRLGLARALYSSPMIIILDESTSSLDMTSELEIIKAIDELDSSTTVVLIAHRLSSIRNFPRTLYLENGSLLGDGPISELRKVIPKLNSQLILSGY
jgi:ABC-type bacteriocin/lantibiotic exporter with double-glycine peptidase domain